MTPRQSLSVVVPVTVAERQQQNTEWVGLPGAALIRRGELTGVLVVKSPYEQGSDEPTVVNLKWIKTAITPVNTSGLIPVSQGLEVGDRVVLNPSADLQDGQPVVIDNAGSANGRG